LGASFRNKASDIEKVWEELDIYNCGRIQHAELIQGLRMMNIFIKDETVFALMKRFASPSNIRGDISKGEFFALANHLLDIAPAPVEPRDEEKERLALAAIELELVRILPGKKRQVLGLIAPFDVSGSGVLSYTDFRGMLEELGAQNITEEQFSLLMAKFDDLGDGTIDLKNFVGRFVAEHSNHEGERHEEADYDTSYYQSGELEDKDGGLGLGGPAAAHLIKKNTEGGYPGIMSSRRNFPHWSKVGVKPFLDPLTHQSMTFEKVVRHYSP